MLIGAQHLWQEITASRIVLRISLWSAWDGRRRKDIAEQRVSWDICELTH